VALTLDETIIKDLEMRCQFRHLMSEGKCIEFSVYDEKLLFENSIRHDANKLEIVRLIAKLENLKYLNLRKSRIDVLPEFQCLDLEHLDISCNGISSFPSWILNLHKLHYLNIGSNQIKFIPDIGHLPLTCLKIHKNQISEFQGGLCKNIQFLNLYLNKFEEIPSVVFGLSRLEFLSFGGTKISNLPDDLVNLRNLKWLCLVANEIEAIPDFFALLDKMVGVNFAKNRIEKIPDSLRNMFALKEISLYSNRIEHVPDSFFELNLCKLNLKKNMLKAEMKSKVRNKFQHISFFDI
jgi:Leucine-rich repeat (LRR) protein